MNKFLLPLAVLLAAAPALAQAIKFDPYPADPYTCSAAVEGDGYMNTTSHTPLVCNATAWTSIFGSGGVTGSGTANTVAKFTGASAIGNGSATDDGTNYTFTTPILAATGTALAPSIAFSASSQAGFYRNAANVIGVAANGVAVGAFGPVNFSLGNASVASPGSSTLQAYSVVAGTTDTAGGALTIRPGAGTGTGAPGNINFQTAPAATSTGSAQNSYATAMTISGSSISLGAISIAGVAGTTTFQSYSRSTAVTDGTGGALTFQSGQGTGTGAGGTVALRIAPAGASTGTSQNAYQTALQILGSDGSFAWGGVNSALASGPATSTIVGVGRASGFTDGAAGSLNIRGGAGTGTGNGGDVTIQVATPATSTGTTVNANGTIALFSGSTGHFTLGGRSMLGAPGASSVQGVNRTATSVTDGAGGSLAVNGGQGTGTGNGGNLTFQVALPASSTGTAANALAAAATISGTNGSIALGGLNLNSAGATAASSFQGTNAASGRTDTAGGTMTIATGRGTGSAAAPTLTLQVAPNAGTGTTQSALKNVFSAGGTSWTLGGVDINSGGTAPATSTLQGYNAAGTDIAGSALVIASGKGTGTGAAGSITLQYAPAASGTGSSQNALVNAESWTTASVADPQNRTATFAGPNGGTWVRGVNTELITLGTGATTTDSTNNLLPAGAIIEAVTTRVTTTITTATAFSVGDGTTAARFSASAGGLTANSTRVGLQHLQGSVTTDAAGPVQATAAKIRITLDAPPGAGVIRVQVWYSQFVAPTS